EARKSNQESMCPRFVKPKRSVRSSPICLDSGFYVSRIRLLMRCRNWFHLMKSKICLRFTPCLEERSSYCERNHAPALCRLPQGLAVWDSARGPHAAPSRRPPPVLGGLRCAGQPAWWACARPPTVVCEREGRLPAAGPGSLGGPEAVGGPAGREPARARAAGGGRAEAVGRLGAGAAL